MKIFKILIPIFLILFATSCFKGEKANEYTNVQDKLMNMESYSSTGSVKYISNKGENSYDINQFAIKNGKYRIETISPEQLKGNIILYDGEMVWQYNPKLDSKISVGDKDKYERKEISIFSFLENHVKSKEVAVHTSTSGQSDYTIIEAKIPGGNKYFDNEKLWINNETKLPEKLIIYDTEGKERVILTYKSFEYNAKLDDNLFNIENIISNEDK